MFPNPDPQPTRITASYEARAYPDGFVLPLLRSLTIGTSSGIFCGLVVFALHLEFNPWLAGLLAWIGITGLAFLRYNERAMQFIERLTGADLPPIYPQPMLPEVDPPSTVRVELVQDEGKRGDFIDLPYPEKLPQLASGLLAGRTFAQESFNHVLKRTAFNELRDVMLARGLARWKVEGAPTQGIELTPAGRAIMKRFAAPPLPPGE